MPALLSRQAPLRVAVALIFASLWVDPIATPTVGRGFRTDLQEADQVGDKTIGDNDRWVQRRQVKADAR